MFGSSYILRCSSCGAETKSLQSMPDQDSGNLDKKLYCLVCYRAEIAKIQEQKLKPVRKEVPMDVLS